jgi:hypothetical protein
VNLERPLVDKANDDLFDGVRAPPPENDASCWLVSKRFSIGCAERERVRPGPAANVGTDTNRRDGSATSGRPKRGKRSILIGRIVHAVHRLTFAV